MSELIPEIHHLVRQQIKSQYEIWRAEYAAEIETFRIENVRFVHDPNWRDQAISIQRIYDFQQTYAGKVFTAALTIGPAVPYLLSLI
jgi:hypothetical protein